MRSREELRKHAKSVFHPKKIPNPQDIDDRDTAAAVRSGQFENDSGCSVLDRKSVSTVGLSEPRDIPKVSQEDNKLQWWVRDSTRRQGNR